MDMIRIIARRELGAYFATPLAYVFVLIFLMMSGVFTFYIGGFFERGQADLTAFFNFHPWLYLFLVPAIAMRLWSEDRRSGTIELLLTLPVTRMQAVLGKYLAAWLFTGLALALSFPLWITVNVLGSPDNGVILSSYIGSWLMAGSFLAIGSCMSALTRNQVIAFITTVVVCFLFVQSGFPLVMDTLSAWAPQVLLDAFASMSFLTHFNAVSKGVIGLRDFLFFLSLTAVWLAATAVVIELKQAE